MDRPTKASWWSRNWKWLVPIGCLLSLILFVGFTYLIMTFGLMKSSDAYIQARKLVVEIKTPIKRIDLLAKPVAMHDLSFNRTQVQVPPYD